MKPSDCAWLSLFVCSGSDHNLHQLYLPEMSTCLCQEQKEADNDDFSTSYLCCSKPGLLKKT